MAANLDIQTNGEWKDVPTLDELVGAMVADLEAARREHGRPEPIMRRYGYVIWDWWMASGREVPSSAPRHYTEDGVLVTFGPLPTEQAKTV